MKMHPKTILILINSHLERLHEAKFKFSPFVHDSMILFKQIGELTCNMPVQNQLQTHDRFDCINLYFIGMLSPQH